MKHFATRTLTVLSLVAAVGFSFPASAFGDTSSSATRTTTTATSAWKTWHQTWVAYFDGLKSINFSYRSSVENARATYFTAIAAATTTAERQAARASLDIALTAAINTRVAAITAAGDPPPPPAGYNGTAYVLGIQAANVAFRASVTAAQSVYADALTSATTYAQRRAARLTLQAAIGNAIVARSSALLALGPPPTHPGQPSN